MKHFLRLIAAFSITIWAGQAYSQTSSGSEAVVFEEIYDEPYAINKLFVQFQPLYTDLFVSNVNVGFGLEATYFLEDRFQFRAHFRKAYARKFDMARDVAEKNSDMDNRPNVFNYFEIGATYHIKDFESEGNAKMMLYRKSYRTNRWASRVPKQFDIPVKVRTIYGARLGAFMYNSSTDLNRALSGQGLPYETITNADGNPLPEDLIVFGNLNATGFYAGASYTRIKNVAIDIEKFEAGVSDLIFTAYFDILAAPFTTLDNVFLNDNEYDVSDLKLNMFGVRAGIDGKFNRTLSWGYGAEMGYRPGLNSRGFYALIKISIPVFSTNFDDTKVEAFQK